jgi:U6 snRNA-associated Sm-like protein LSm8
MSFNLKQYLGKFVYVILTEGHVIEGKLAGFDNHLNITVEKQIIKKEENDITSVEIIRGENIVLIGELDAEKVAKINEKVDEKDLTKYYNNKDYKLFKSTKNKVNRTDIKTWKLYNQLRSKTSMNKRKLSDGNDVNNKKIKKSDIRT